MALVLAVALIVGQKYVNNHLLAELRNAVLPTQSEPHGLEDFRKTTPPANKDTTLYRASPGEPRGPGMKLGDIHVILFRFFGFDNFTNLHS